MTGKGMFVGLMIACGVMALRADVRQSTPRTLVAVFAHPDDETIAGPLLAHYASQRDTRVHLVVVTNGDKGVTPFANIPAGEQLAAVRAQDAVCACQALGAQPPVLLGCPDAGLTSTQVLGAVTAKLTATLANLKPDALVTWGPDGGYGHPDHRLVSAVLTQLVAAGATTQALYYTGLPKSRLDADDVKALKFPAPFAPTLDDLLQTRVPYTTADAERAKRSLACHGSQFTPESMDLIVMLMQKVHDGRMHLRHWSGGPPRSDLFDAKP